MLPSSLCRQWQPDRAANAAQDSRSYTTAWDTIAIRRNGIAADHVERHRVLLVSGLCPTDTHALFADESHSFPRALRGARRQPDLDLAAGEAGGGAIEVRLDLDVGIDADAAQPPFGQSIGLAGQRP